MGRTDWNSLWFEVKPGVDFDPPACETGLMLLRRWANQDPTLIRILPTIPDDAKGPYAEAFYKHRNVCVKCNETAPPFSSEAPNFD